MSIRVAMFYLFLLYGHGKERFSSLFANIYEFPYLCCRRGFSCLPHLYSVVANVFLLMAGGLVAAVLCHYHA